MTETTTLDAYLVDPHEAWLQEIGRDPLRHEPPPLEEPGGWHRRGGSPERPDPHGLSYAEGMALALRGPWKIKPARKPLRTTRKERRRW